MAFPVHFIHFHLSVRFLSHSMHEVALMSCVTFILNCHMLIYIMDLLGPRQRMLAELLCFRLVHLSVCPSVRRSVVTLTQSFFIGFLPNFIYGLLLITSSSSLNMGFVRHPVTKIADKMAATYQYPLSWSL